MICINCCYPVDSLYVVYSSNHIRLTDCPRCKKVVDRYVEFDNVLLFIDLLLLKSGAYRHLVYNSLESTLEKYPSKTKSTQLPRTFGDEVAGTISDFREWFVKFDQLNRVWVLIFAFEVYLTWVSEERKYQTYSHYYPADLDLLMSKILSGDALSQYFYFAVYCILDLMLLHNLTQYLLVNWTDWGRNIKYAKYVVSYTILLSYGAKIFPILMLIWPYDTLLSTSIIKWVANLYIIEALKIVTNLRYREVVRNFVIIFIVRCLCVKPILAILVSKGDYNLCIHYIRGEYEMFLHRFLSGKYFYV
ncbi:LAFE_0H06194g1_1 [Lachancea fermentati]|uniref:Protein ARV n=1 Tax=Lachancea fermentati TaxID=4955 RepID=A0A1G4MJR6_LACFM|nr:LAFE_0H06194g1_1 [Lachancea fermentati]